MKRIHILNQNDYERINPQALLSQYGKYFTNGTDNSYFYKVESMYLGSPTNQAIIDNFTNYILGDGLTTEDGQDLSNILSKEDLRLAVSDFKTQGQMAFQVIYDYNGDLTKLYFVAVKTLAVNREKDILDDPTGYWYSFDWNLKSKFKPELLPAFGKGDGKQSEILYIKRQSPQPIFALPDWQSGIQYCEVEMEQSNFFVNHIKNGFAPQLVVNINEGGTDSDEAMDTAKRTILNNLTGTSGDRIIVAFNDNKENATTVDTIDIPDAYQQFDFVSKEATSKIMLSHKVNDPGLFGLPTPSGFSSEADKMVASLKLLYRSQINPMREIITDGLERAFKLNDPNVELVFTDFEELQVEEIEEVEVIEPTNMKEHNCDDDDENCKFNDVDQLVDLGEDVDLDEWELVDDSPVEFDENGEEIFNFDFNKYFNDQANTGRAVPNAKSDQDIQNTYKIRYRYNGSKVPQREFCIKMMLANKIYRKEDIERMESSNTQFAPKGKSTYSVWLYKGGVNCKHFWTREIYANKNRSEGVDVNNPNADTVNATEVGRESGEFPEKNDPLIYQTPNSMPNGARLN